MKSKAQAIFKAERLSETHPHLNFVVIFDPTHPRLPINPRPYEVIPAYEVSQMDCVVYNTAVAV